MVYVGPTGRDAPAPRRLAGPAHERSHDAQEWVARRLPGALPPLAARNRATWQPPKSARIGILLFSAPQADPQLPTLRQGLRDLGCLEGQNILLDYRYAEGQPERLPDLAADLVRLRPDLIFALRGDTTQIAKRATAAIPIVASMSSDPVQNGLVASRGRPGGNLTGVPGDPDHAAPEFCESQRAARILGVRLHSLEVRRAGDFEGAFQSAVRGRAEALVVVPSRVLVLNRQRIADLAGKHRLILVGGWGGRGADRRPADVWAGHRRDGAPRRHPRGQDPERHQTG